MNENNIFGILRSLVFSTVLIGAGIGFFTLYKQQKTLKTQVIGLAQGYTNKPGVISSTVPAVPFDQANGQPPSWMKVQQKVKNTVVKIISNIAAFNWFEPYKTPEMGQGSGSGFFINAEGDIITNFHVINQAKSMQIEIPALGAERLDVEVVGASPERDIAILRLTPDTKERIEKELGKIPFLQFGDSDTVQPGQDVLALGYPLDVQALKSTQGIVSGRERIKIINLSCFQTTAPLNPGNSGGPALDANGRVIGVNFAGVVQAQNVGYFIPINELKSAINDLHKIKLLRRPVLGCSFQGANEDMVTYLGNPMPGGFYIPTVFKNMILEKSGVLAGDMVYEINGFKVDRFGKARVPWTEEKVSVMDIIERLEVGDKVDVVLYRKGVRKEIEFVLEPRYIQAIRFVYPDFENVDYEAIGGLVIMELALNHVALFAEQVHQLLEFESPENQYEPTLVISYVQPTSLASKLRLAYPGLVITEVNGEKVKTLKELRKAVGKSKKSRYLTINTKDNLLMVMSVENISADEDRLTKLYAFSKSKLIEEIA